MCGIPYHTIPYHMDLDAGDADDGPPPSDDDEEEDGEMVQYPAQPVCILLGIGD